MPFFDEFISKSQRGKRLKKDGKKISDGTIKNYRNLQKLLLEFEQKMREPIRVVAFDRLTHKERIVEKNYWKRFYQRFSEFMYKRGCFDNYIGTQFKTLRVVFRYIQQDKMINIGEFYKAFYVVKEETPILTLMPEQLKMLIYDTAFETQLSPQEKYCKDMFVFGCTVALRFSDLRNIKAKDIEKIGGNYYLTVLSQKTAIETKVKLPEYAIQIMRNIENKTEKNAKLFTKVSLFWFNRYLKRLIEKAGWNHEIGKTRKKMGISISISKKEKKSFRFCDLVSSHTMRKTAITTMLMHGVPERVVRKISGHAESSVAFGRYVNLAQSYMDNSIDRHHELLQK